MIDVHVIPRHHLAAYMAVERTIAIRLEEHGAVLIDTGCGWPTQWVIRQVGSQIAIAVLR